jgi:hypothetical protein
MTCPTLLNSLLVTNLRRGGGSHDEQKSTAAGCGSGDEDAGACSMSVRLRCYHHQSSPANGINRELYAAVQRTQLDCCIQLKHRLQLTKLGCQLQHSCTSDACSDLSAVLMVLRFLMLLAGQCVCDAGGVSAVPGALMWHAAAAHRGTKSSTDMQQQGRVTQHACSSTCTAYSIAPIHASCYASSNDQLSRACVIGCNCAGSIAAFSRQSNHQ